MLNEAHVENMMRRAGKARAQVICSSFLPILKSLKSWYIWSIRRRPCATSEAPGVTVYLFWRLRDTTPPPWRPVVEFWTWSVFVQICYSSRSFAQTYKELLRVVLHQPRQRLLLHHPWHRFASNDWNECRLTSLGASASRRVVARAWGSPKPKYLFNLQQMVSV